ncbi:MAG: rhodanese-like domain-containing protein [Planktotalea sp.]|uniref:rhodanese-like domain-containing protein n=1 Tax=Planktotalea sp. TaxID=2029877 RepID=UPI003C723EDD
MKCHIGVALLVACATMASSAMAQDVRITQDLDKVSVNVSGVNVLIERNQNQANRLSSEFTKTSRPCPPFCIQPMTLAEGVSTFGELEVIGFLQDEVAAGKGLLIDTRLPEWHEKGSIPGAVNLPFSTLEDNNPFRDEILRALGANDAGGSWDFSKVFTLTLFCNGPWCEQTSRAVTALLEVGYPPEKLNFYRGGMQSWLLLGLTTTNPAG